VLDVNVPCHVGSHGVLGKLARSLVVLVECCGTALLFVDILHELQEVHSASSSAIDCHILCFCGG
jgi:hypothetical protein